MADVVMTVDQGMQLLVAMGAEEGLIYVSVPITSGRREQRLMRQLACSRDELRQRYGDIHRRKVIIPNERQARKYSAMVRQQSGGRLVLNPGTLFVPGWSQRDYLDLWTYAINSFAQEVVVTPEWAYGTGERIEVNLALLSMLKVSNLQGRQLSVDELEQMDRMAKECMNADGWTDAEISAYCPRVEFDRARLLITPDREAASSLAKFTVEHNERSKGYQQDATD
jgi:hypothetical protein